MVEIDMFALSGSTAQSRQMVFKIKHNADYIVFQS